MLGTFALLIERAPARAQSPTVAVFPIPGSKVAPPGSQITFRGVPASQLGTITVTGSKSGHHSGKVEGDSDGNGGSFIPDQPFSSGETVTVTTGLNILGTGKSSSGAAGLSNSYSFTVANPAGAFPVLHWPAARRAHNDIQFYHSRHDLSPAAVTMTRTGNASEGDVFVAPQWGPLQTGPMILDPKGNLVWFDPMKGDGGKDSATDFRVQSYQGKPVLTWWTGYLVAGIGIGEDLVFDQTYRQIAVVKAGNGLSADLHEFQITPQGTALIVANYPVFWDARSIHGSSHQNVIDSVVQEIDIKTGLVLYQWDSLDHIPLSYSYAHLPQTSRSPYDPYHINSIDPDRDGNLVISMRNTWAAYKINRQTGAIIWQLGGRHSSFKLARGTFWAWQHDVRVRANNDMFLTMFDDDAGPPKVYSNSRGLKLFVDLKHMTAKAVDDFGHSPNLSSNYEGNYQQLPNGNPVVGWGQQPYFTEFDSHGHTVLDGRFLPFTASYRAYRFVWHAVPWTTPAVLPDKQGSKTVVYTSWNGATDVASWRVLGGASSSSLKSLATARKTSFETKITVPTQAYVQVQALDSHGSVIKSSNPVPVK